MKQILIILCCSLLIAGCNSNPSSTEQPSQSTIPVSPSDIEPTLDEVFAALKARGLTDNQLLALERLGLTLQEMLDITDEDIARIFAPGAQLDGWGGFLATEQEHKEVHDFLSSKGLDEHSMILGNLGYTYKEILTMSDDELEFVLPNTELVQNLVAKGVEEGLFVDNDIHKGGYSSFKHLIRETLDIEMNPLDSLALKTKHEAYQYKNPRIEILVTNYSLDVPVTLSRDFYIDRKVNGNWQETVYNKETPGQLDNPGVQEPIDGDIDHIRQIGVYVGDLADENGGIPIGEYRITLPIGGNYHLSYDFAFQKGEVEQDFSIAQMAVKKDSIDSNTPEITILITNFHHSEINIGLAYHLEKFIDGSWVSVEPKSEMNFNEIALIIPEGTTYEENISLGDFYSLPLETGRYRIVKYLTSLADFHWAEFTVI